MKIEVVTKATHEVDTDKITACFYDLIAQCKDYSFVPISVLKDAAGVIETLVADNQKKDARIKEVIRQCDKLFEEKKTVEEQRDGLADKLAELASEKVKKSGIEPGPVKVECSRKAREHEKAVTEAENILKDWAFRTFGCFGDLL